MYLSNLDTNQTFSSLYRSLLKEVIAGNDVVKIKDELDKAIEEALDVILGKKEAYLISNKHFYFTSFLINNKDDVFEEPYSKEITNTTYHNIVSALHA
ncbi:hypothetical protein CMT19_04280 [Elizabethkingia anophelis]|nr:hypothetical protein [Elizabethkingia anophelis]